MLVSKNVKDNLDKVVEGTTELSDQLSKEYRSIDLVTSQEFTRLGMTSDDLDTFRVIESDAQKELRLELLRFKKQIRLAVVEYQLVPERVALSVKTLTQLSRQNRMDYAEHIEPYLMCLIREIVMYKKKIKKSLVNFK